MVFYNGRSPSKGAGDIKVAHLLENTTELGGVISLSKITAYDFRAFFFSEDLHCEADPGFEGGV